MCPQDEFPTHYVTPVLKTETVTVSGVQNTEKAAAARGLSCSLISQEDWIKTGGKLPRATFLSSSAAV